jgi:hypothetical protein
MRYWNMAAQRYFPGLARWRRALRLSADRAGNAACKPARKAGVLDHEDKVTRETDSLLERAGFGKGAPGILGNLVAELVDANKRRFWLRDGGVGPVARRQTHRAPPKPQDRTPLGHAHDAAGCI